jgi:hypothetical protein
MKNIKLFTVLAGALLIMGFTSCIFSFNNGIKGNGNIVKEKRNVSDFNKIEISGYYKVFLTQGDENSLEIKADENLMEYLKTKTEDNELEISVKKSINPTKVPVIFLTFKDLKSIDLNGACEILGQNFLKFDKLEVEGSGATYFDLDMKAAEVDFDLSGATKITLSGKADNVKFDGSGAIKISAFEFTINNCDIDLSGASSAGINVTGNLKIDLSGASNLLYKGNPKIIKIETSGASSAKKAE